MIEIVGAVYTELCLEPQWIEIYGSGGRAAAALSKLNEKVLLNTYAAQKMLRSVELLANGYEFELKTLPHEQTINFDYYHCLSTPRISPPINLIKQAPPHSISSENVLRFGFLEGDAIVQGEKVVYDPQNAYSPKLFGENGSTAERLAIVANFGECLKMAGEQPSAHIDPQVLGKRLIERENAEVVVVKQGSLGAIVVSTLR